MYVENNIICGSPGRNIITNISFSQYLYDKLRDNVNRVIQIDVDTGKLYTAKDALLESIRVAKVLQACGIKSGDKVAVIIDNRPIYFSLVAGILYTGATVVLLNPAYSEGEYRHMLNINQPQLAIVTQKTETIISKVASTANWTMKLIQLDDNSISSNVPTFKELSNKHAKVANPDEFSVTPIADTSKHMATILCSSGTTGLPKGVVLTHKNWIANLNNSSEPGTLETLPADRILLFLPFYHGYALSMLTKSVCEGGTICMMRSFNMDRLVKLVEQYKITLLPVAPPVLVALAKYPELDKYDFGSLRQLICGAAAFPLDVAKEINKRLGVCIRNGYGMTEVTVLSHLSDSRIPVSEGLGILLPGIRAKIADQNTGEPLPPGKIGEICLKGEQVMLGYYNNPQATAEAIDSDNWLHTGDLGYYKENGETFVTGRIKELIKYKGFQVSPTEIETIIQGHPGVQDAAVVGKPDESSGELPLAFVVKQPGSTVTAKEIIDLTNGQLSRQKWLRGGVMFIQSIPKNPTGKIRRKDLLALISKM